MLPTRGRPRKNAATVQTVLYCCYGTCNSRSNSLEAGVKMLKFPAPCATYRSEPFVHNDNTCSECAKSLRWIHLCKRADGRLDSLAHVNSKKTFICSKHFIDPGGPTDVDPDPLPADAPAEKQEAVRRRKRAPPRNRNPPESKKKKPAITKNDQCEAAAKNINAEAMQDMSVLQPAVDITGTLPTNAPNFNNKTLYRPSLDIKTIAEYLFRAGWPIKLGSEVFEVFFISKASIKIHCVFKEDLTCEVFVLDHVLSSDHKLWRSRENKNTFSTFEDITQFLTSLNSDWLVCDCMCNNAVATLEHGSCSLLTAVSKPTCYYCKKALQLNRNSQVRSQRKPKKTTSQTNIRFLSKTATHQRLRKTLNDLKRYKIKASRLAKRLQKLICNSGVLLSAQENEEFGELLKSDKATDVNSFKSLFVQQQLYLSNKKKPQGYRWHPALIKWCLYLRQKSSSAYAALRNSEFITLPSEKTLYRYQDINIVQPGFSKKNIDTLTSMITASGPEEHRRYCSLAFDEMKVSEDLMYRTSTGELVGYTNLNNVEERLTEIQENLQPAIEKKNAAPKFASHVLQLMVVGITSNVRFPFAYFASKDTSAAGLFSVLWEAVEMLEEANIKVLAFVSDGASQNRTLYNMCVTDPAHPYRTPNPYAHPERFLYFVCDVPHLMKTARNCLRNSGFSEKSTRCMWRNKKFLEWRHILELYCKDLSSEFRILPHLTDEHLFLTPYSAMRVKLAVQVLSKRTATALKFLGGDETTETVHFLEMFNKFFDIMNTRHLHEATQRKNPDLAPFTSADDPRLQWLTDEFLGYLDSWKTEVYSQPGEMKKAERNKKLLSTATLSGLHITVWSVTSIIKFLLAAGAHFVMTGKLNQDCLEMYFCQQRGAAGANENPNILRYGQNAAKLQTLKNYAMQRRGNISQAV